MLALVAVLGVTIVAQQPEPPAQESRPSFVEWLAGVKAEALSRGIRQEIVDQALANIEEPLPVVLERDRTQAETVLSLEQYVQRQLTAARIRTGRQMMARHKDTLDKVAPGGLQAVGDVLLAALPDIEQRVK